MSIDIVAQLACHVERYGTQLGDSQAYFSWDIVAVQPSRQVNILLAKTMQNLTPKQPP